MKNLSLKNRRVSPQTLAAFVGGLALACLPAVARADVKESWETGVDAAKWTTSTTANSYVVPDAANPIVIRNSIVDDGPGAACAGKYVRETRAQSGGRIFSVGATGVQAITAGTKYCVSAWIRGPIGAAPYVGISYSNAAGVPTGAPSAVDNECYILGNGVTNSAAYCQANLASKAVPTDGNWAWIAQDFTPAAPLPGTHVILKPVNFTCGTSGCTAVGVPAADFDDIRITTGACPATPPADTAPHVACAGTTPVCVGGDAANNAKCMDCNGNNGQAGATRACQNPALPVCIGAGANKGSCIASCTGDFGSAGASPCAAATPFCVAIGATAFKECKACAGNDGSTMMPACPPANPTCFTAGAKAGQCGKCTTTADCGGTTPRCDVGTGRCTDDCDKDADCGDKKSGKICNGATLKCADGCRGDTSIGNGCPDGSKCSSVDLKPGTCTVIPVPDAGPPDSSTPDAGPTPTEDSGTVTPPTDDAGTTEPTTPVTPGGEDAGGGCSASPSSTAGSTAVLAAMVGLAFGAMRRRRRNDA
jgi:MYXO-CTERM domain-containing protein